MKRDRYGEEIEVGDVVVSAITINHDTYRGFSFTVNIVRQAKGGLILDGVWTTCPLSARKPAELVKLTPTTDLQVVDFEFRKEFGPK